MPKKTVTIAICTWNRSQLLDQTLERMKTLRIPDGLDWELLVVNNNSTDDTDAVVARHAACLPISLLHEVRQGLSHARNCAVAHASGELLLWTDDDVLVSPQWLEAYVAAADCWSETAFFGGPIEPWFETPPPAWVIRHRDRLEGILITRRPMPDGAPIVKGRLPFGANFAVRTDLLRRYPFDPALGRCGHGMVGGDETDLLYRMIDAGLQGRWVADAQLQHFVVSSRCTVRYVKRFFEGIGMTNALQPSAALAPELLGVPRYALKKFVANALKAAVMTPTRSASWLTAVCEAARAKGVIQHARGAKRG